MRYVLARLIKALTCAGCKTLQPGLMRLQIITLSEFHSTLFNRYTFDVFVYFQIGMSYSCWYSVIDPSEARWDEPTTFVGMMFLIGGGILTVLGFVGIVFSYRAYKNF